MIATVAGYLFASDRAVSKYENDTLGYMDEEMYVQLQKNEEVVHTSASDKALRYLNDNRWSVIGKLRSHGVVCVSKKG